RDALGAQTTPLTDPRGARRIPLERSKNRWCSDADLRLVRRGVPETPNTGVWVKILLHVLPDEKEERKRRVRQRGGSSEGGVSKIRERVLDRDDHTCQRCGCAVESENRSSQRSAEVHHLIPRAAGGPDALANLITLCLRCHKEAHSTMSKLHETNSELLQELRETA
ncbi:HNH endonuclease, partial [Halorubrum sp. SS5]